ncbi:MAG: mercuric transporter MerT family protein [Acidobacteriota bacterium]
MSTGNTGAGAAITGAVSAALLSAACCLGPLVLAFLGIGGAGAALALAPYRPWFLAATVLFLGVGFYRMYRGNRTECGEGESCTMPRARRYGRVLLWVATVIVILVATFPEYSIYLF